MVSRGVVTGSEHTRIVPALLVLLFALGISFLLSPLVAHAAQLSLSWVDNSGGTASFNVERKTRTTGTYALLVTTSPGVTTYVDSTVTAGTTYCYRVMATSGAGGSGYSNEACGAPTDGSAVTVTMSGSGSGTVTSSPAGISCPGTCSASFSTGTVVTLTAAAASGSSFGGWSGGGCAGTAPCVLTGNASVSVTAPFSLNGTAPTPSISSLSPPSVGAGSGAFGLTVNGSGFVNGVTATVGGQARTVTFGSASQLTISVAAGDIASPGSVAVRVSNPSPCAGGACASNSATLSVTTSTPAPTLSGINPTTVTAGGTAFILTATGANFTAASVVRVNGASRTTSFVSGTQLTASIPASDIASPGTATITVFTPAPGGGTSGGKTLTVQGPSLSVSSTSVAPGGSLTATLSNSPGGSTDWIGLAPVGSADTTYLQWVYVGAGVSNRTWTVTVPTTPGQYEFRFYLNNGYVVAARSAAVTVGSSNPRPSITGLSPASVSVGSGGFSLTVTGSGFVNGATASVGGQARSVSVTSATQASIAVQAADLASAGGVAVQVTNPAPCASGCASNSVSLNVTALAPSLTVNATSTSPGGSITTTLSNAPGGSTDWIGLAPVGSADTTYLQWVYVGAGVTSRTWTVIMPTTPGTYEFRFYLNNGYVVSARSPAVTVSAGPPKPAITVSATSAPLGGWITATLTNGAGGSTDWIGLAPVGSADTTYLQWVYVGAGVTSRTWTVIMPTTPGTYEFRFYLNDGYVVSARSPAVLVGP